VFFPVVWLTLLLQHGPRGNDWLQFHLTATQFVSGDWSDLYTQRLDTAHPGYFWRYPPYVLLLIAPFAWTTATVTYGVLAASGGLAILASLVILARMRPVPEPGLWTLAIVLSAPALTTIITGQLSALLLLCVVAAAALWDRGRIRAAGMVLGLLAIKPNLGVFFAVYLIARRQWRAAAAMFSVFGVLTLATVPLGSELWRDFVRVSMSNVDTAGWYHAYKLITLKGFFGAVFQNSLATSLWIGVSIGLLAATVWSWFRRRSDPVAQLAQAMLLAVAASPYGFFYDALLLVFPATAWWWARGHWNGVRWRLIGALLLLTWCWEHASHTWVELFAMAGWRYRLPFSLVGVVAAAWLVVSLLEAETSDQPEPGVK
jgi:hypothetical protein